MDSTSKCANCRWLSPDELICLNDATEYARVDESIIKECEGCYPFYGSNNNEKIYEEKGLF